MSKAWAKGSTPGWRRLRGVVLSRDGYRCQLRVEGVCIERANTAHHTLGKAYGDDPAHLVAACAPCNSHVGNPERFDPPGQCGIVW